MLSKGDIKVSTLFKEKKQYIRDINTKNISGSEDQEGSLIDKEFKPPKIIKNQNKKIKFLTKKRKNNPSPCIISHSSNNDNKKNPSNIISVKVVNFQLLSTKNNKKNIENYNLSTKTKKILEKILSKKNSNINTTPKKNISSKINSKQLINNIPKSLTSSTLNKTTNDTMKISQKTLEIIKKLKEKRNNGKKSELKKSIIKNSNSFTNLKMKYKEFLHNSRELRLPIIYKELIDIFDSLEQTINRNKISSKNIMNIFSNIKQSIESITHKTFTVNILKKILYIVPHFYILKYIPKNNTSIFSLNEDIDKNYDLVIDIPSDYKERLDKNYAKTFNFLEINFFDKNNENNFSPIEKNLSIKEIQRRKQIFSDILYQIVNEYYQKFLQDKNIEPNFDPMIEKTWHHDFDPDKYCKDIPLFEIPSPQEDKSIFAEIINNNDLKKQILEIEKEKNKKYDDNLKIIKPSKINKYVSESYMEKIREKSKLLKIEREISQYNLFYNQKNEKNKIIKNIFIQIKTLLMINNNSLILDKLSDMILESDKMYKNYFLNSKNLKKAIIELSKELKGFINIINHSSFGYIVVLENPEYSIPENLLSINFETN